jgi:pimeloyl-ACP methyl ester carboxylesterase
MRILGVALRRRWVVAVLTALSVLVATAAIMVILVETWEPAYVLYKRISAASPYVYDEIKPEYAATDPTQFLSIEKPEAVEPLRAELREIIREGWPGSTEFDNLRGIIEIHSDELPTKKLAELRALSPLASLRAFRFDFGGGTLSYAVHLRPPDATGETVVLLYGFAGEFQDAHDYVTRLLSRGLSVIGLNLLAYGGNSIYRNLSGALTNLHHQVEDIPGGIFPHVAQITWAMSLAQSLDPGRPVHLAGFSMGAYMVTLAAAIDPRPAVVSANSGIYPAYLRDRKQDTPVGVAAHRRLLAAASHLDLMLLASLGVHRHYMQVFNRYDRCCYSNTKGRLYEPALRDRIKTLGLPGDFHVVIDESHGRHKLSTLGADALIETIKASAH